MDTTTPRPAWFVLTRHWLSLTGMALVTTAGISWLFVLPKSLHGESDNPYVGIVFFLVLPAVFFLGLALIPIGVYLGKRHIQQKLAEGTFDRKAALQRLAWFFGITTLANLLIGTQVTYRAVKHMETPQFCGGSCHSMNPELAAYQNSPHSRVECVECHVEPGAAGWVSSKAAGVRQLVHTVLNTYPRPILSGVASNRLVPASETCEHCHWPQNFSGTRLRVLSKFAKDEANTRSETVLLMMVGGGRFSGIHGAHFGPGIHIRFAATDAARQTIPWVEYRNTTTGVVRTFSSSDEAPGSEKGLPVHEMQCVDCHNRATHVFDLPDRAMDNAMARGDISSSLPNIKKKGVELLTATYATRDAASTQIPEALESSYRQQYAAIYAQRPQDIRDAGKAVLAIYNRNIFPDLKVSWGIYPNNLGHTDSPGCFRCHDGSHAASDGNAITQDCSACHEVLATDEAKPEILKTLGIEERITKMAKQ